jgi:hypothetical protein
MRGIRHRHGLHCQAVVVAAALLLSATSADAFGTCKQPGLSVSGANNETIDVCSAVADVLDYFRKGGISTELELTIRFQRTVHVEAVNLLDGSSRPYSVSGVYRADRREIQMVDSHSPRTYARRPWKLPWDRQIADSILRHEVIHAVINQLMGSRREKLPRAWHEALAYGVQVDLMDEDLRARVLAQYPDQEAFSATLQINDLVYGFDPDAFAVSAYKTYMKEGRLEFLKKAIGLELEMIDLNDFLY